jgi:hypothetical protein
MIDHALAGEELLAGRDRRRGQGSRAVGVQARVADPAAVHQLGDDLAAGGVDGVGDRPPGQDLLAGVQARGLDVALADLADLDRLGDDQSGGGPLGVVLGGQLVHQAAPRPAARHRRHHEPVGQVQLAQRQRLEEFVHGCVLRSRVQ